MDPKVRGFPSARRVPGDPRDHIPLGLTVLKYRGVPSDHGNQEFRSDRKVLGVREVLEVLGVDTTGDVVVGSLS